MSAHGRLSSRSEGQFNPNRWINEGDGLFASSKKMRAIWQGYRNSFSKIISQQETGECEEEDVWSLLSGLPRASMLLLGYAAEMYLKAGIVKAYIGCSNEMFDRDIKERYGHNLTKMAETLSFDILTADRESLKALEKMVLCDARYPIFADSDAPFIPLVNDQTMRIWSDENYEELRSLSERLRMHVSGIDGDESNPASVRSFDIDDDGYLVFRIGGNLPTRISYRLSTKMLDAGQDQLCHVKALFDTGADFLILRYWDQAWIYEDVRGRGKTAQRQCPKS